MVWWRRLYLQMQEELVPSLVRDLRLPHASQPKIQNRKQKQYCNKSNKDFKNHPSILKKKKKPFLKKKEASVVKNLPAKQETWVRSLGWEAPLEKERATQSRILCWRILWTEAPEGLYPRGLKKS